MNQGTALYTSASTLANLLSVYFLSFSLKFSAMKAFYESSLYQHCYPQLKGIAAAMINEEAIANEIIIKTLWHHHHFYKGEAVAQEMELLIFDTRLRCLLYQQLTIFKQPLPMPGKKNMPLNIHL